LFHPVTAIIIQVLAKAVIVVAPAIKGCQDIKKLGDENAHP
jgi:hypothetical protein